MATVAAHTRAALDTCVVASDWTDAAVELGTVQYDS
jgi:hypothetical protein